MSLTQTNSNSCHAFTYTVSNAFSATCVTNFEVKIGASVVGSASITGNGSFEWWDTPAIFPVSTYTVVNTSSSCGCPLIGNKTFVRAPTQCQIGLTVNGQSGLVQVAQGQTALFRVTGAPNCNMVFNLVYVDANDLPVSAVTPIATMNGFAQTSPGVYEVTAAPAVCASAGRIKVYFDAASPLNGTCVAGCSAPPPLHINIAACISSTITYNGVDFSPARPCSSAVLQAAVNTIICGDPSSFSGLTPNSTVLVDGISVAVDAYGYTPQMTLATGAHTLKVGATTYHMTKQP